MLLYHCIIMLDLKISKTAKYTKISLYCYLLLHNQEVRFTPDQEGVSNPSSTVWCTIYPGIPLEI